MGKRNVECLVITLVCSVSFFSQHAIDTSSGFETIPIVVDAACKEKGMGSFKKVL